MASSLCFSNGELYVNLDKNGLVNNLFFPYIGSELHTYGTKHKVGVWIDGVVSWIDDGNWKHKSHYPYYSLVGHTVVSNEEIGILIEFEDFVDASNNIFLRNIHIVNLKSDQREVRLFTHQSFNIGNTNLLDTVQYLPDRHAVLHYGGRRAFIASGQTDVGLAADQHSVGLFGKGRDGTWRDAEDGELTNGNVDNGQTDSTLRFSLTIGGLSSRRVHYWLCAATSIRVAKSLDSDIRQNGILHRLEATGSYWRNWVSPSLKIAERLSPKHRRPFVQALLQMKASIDRRGAMVSVNNLDQESYMHLTEASFAIWPFIRLGYKEEVINFLGFCRDRVSDEGYLLNSYRADGAVAPISLPYDEKLPPISSDNISLAAFVTAQAFTLLKQNRITKDFYSSLLSPIIDFLCEFTNESGLLNPSYEPGDDQKSLSTYAVAAAYAALVAASDVAETMKDQSSMVKWRTASEELHKSALPLTSENNNLYKSSSDRNPNIRAFFGAFMFGLYDITSPVISETVKRLEQSLGLAESMFAKSPESTDIDYIGSLWMSQYYMEVGRDDEASQIINKVINDMDAGLLDESSKVWVCAELVSSLLDTMTRK